MNEAARALANMRWRYSASASTFRCRVGSATTVMIASIKRCRNQDVVAYLSYKQDTHPLFAVKCEHKELKRARVALSAEKTDSAAENALTVANLQLQDENLYFRIFIPDKNVRIYTITDGASITLPR